MKLKNTEEPNNMNLQENIQRIKEVMGLNERQDDINVKEVNDIFERFVLLLKNSRFHIGYHSNNKKYPYLTLIIDIPKEDVKFKTQSDFIVINLTNLKQNDLHYVPGRKSVKASYSINEKNNIPYIDVYDAGFKLDELSVLLNKDEIIERNETAIKHELTHYIDEVMKGRPMDSLKKIEDKLKKNKKQIYWWEQGDSEFNKQYRNTPSENNALIMAFLSSVKKVPNTFKEFLNDFVDFGKKMDDQNYKEMLSNPDEKKRKSLIGRLYQFYKSFKNDSGNEEITGKIDFYG